MTNAQKKKFVAGMALCDRMHEIAMPPGWFNPDKVDAFVCLGFVLVVDNGDYLFPQPPILVNPKNQAEVLR